MMATAKRRCRSCRRWRRSTTSSPRRHWSSWMAASYRARCRKTGSKKNSPAPNPRRRPQRTDRGTRAALVQLRARRIARRNPREAAMALMDFLSKQFIDIIEWVDDSRDTLSFRFPDQDKEIKRGAQLIVRESQIAQFVYLGQFGDTFGPGKHTLTTDNIPILSDLKGWKYGFESPFKADVYYVTTRVFTGNKWGTSNPVMMHDADLGVVRARAFGIYDFH